MTFLRNTSEQLTTLTKKGAVARAKESRAAAPY